MIIYINHYYIHCMEFFFVHNLLKLKKKKKETTKFNIRKYSILQYMMSAV